MIHIVLLALIIVALGVIGWVLSKIGQQQMKLISMLTNLLKFVLKTEFFSGPGKSNVATGIVIIIAALILAFPLLFIVIYQVIFGDKIIDANVFNKVLYYFAGCMIPISLIEACLQWKTQNLKK